MSEERIYSIGLAKVKELLRFNSYRKEDTQTLIHTYHRTLRRVNKQREFLNDVVSSWLVEDLYFVAECDTPNNRHIQFVTTKQILFEALSELKLRKIDRRIRVRAKRFLRKIKNKACITSKDSVN